MKLAQSLRQEIGQLSYSFKARNSFRQLRNQFKAIKYITFNNLPSISRGKNKGEVWAISVVKNELDILPASIEHLLRQGVDKILIVDNMSTDGTAEYLQQLAANVPNVYIGTDTNPAHHQSEKMTYLSFIAWCRGAEWVIPFDADEFWYARKSTLKEYLLSTPHDVLYAGFHHTVPLRPNPENIFDSELVMDSAYSVPGKIAFRAHPLAVVIPGNHEVTRLGTRALALEIVHVQYRGPQQIARKVRQGTASSLLTGENLDWFAPHWAAGSLLSDSEIQDAWKTISQGKAEPRIKFAAIGPMIRGKFLQWSFWDEYEEYSNLWEDEK